MDPNAPVSDAQPAASSPAPVVDSSAFLAGLSGAQLRTWQETGELPDATPSDAKASDSSPDTTKSPESSPAAPDAQAASTEAKPEAASEPATPAKGKDKRKGELDSEIQELLQRRAQIREELAREEAAFRARQQPSPDAKPAESSPAAADPTLDPSDPRPAVNDFEDYESYLDARDAWNFRRWERARTHEAQIASQRQAVVSAYTDATQRVATYLRDEHLTQAEFQSKLSPEIARLEPISLIDTSRVAPTVDHLIAEAVFRSDFTPHLMVHLSEHPETLQQLRAARGPEDIFRQIGRLEAQLSAPQAPSQPSPKVISSAPRPPDTLGRKPAAPPDEEFAAVAREDFAAFERAANARAVAALTKV